MGALHRGHLSLVEASREVCGYTAATIFVNPTQFGPGEDFERYPRCTDEDLARLKKAEVDLVFMPEVASMYPAGASTLVSPPHVAETLEGRFRPGHFAGVATVVLKLFHILPATDAFFGEKDYQQLLVIRHMVRDLNVDIRIHGCGIVREPDGLALSSRNRYLNEKDRRRAVEIWRCLCQVGQDIRARRADPAQIEATAQAELRAAGFDPVDYVAIRDPETLEPVQRWDGPVVVLVAAHLGSTRLIDNIRVDPNPA